MTTRVDEVIQGRTQECQGRVKVVIRETPVSTLEDQRGTITIWHEEITIVN